MATKATHFSQYNVYDPQLEPASVPLDAATPRLTPEWTWDSNLSWVHLPADARPATPIRTTEEDIPDDILGHILSYCPQQVACAMAVACRQTYAASMARLVDRLYVDCANEIKPAPLGRQPPRFYLDFTVVPFDKFERHINTLVALPVRTIVLNKPQFSAEEFVTYLIRFGQCDIFTRLSETTKYSTACLDRPHPRIRLSQCGEPLVAKMGRRASFLEVRCNGSTNLLQEAENLLRGVNKLTLRNVNAMNPYYDRLVARKFHLRSLILDGPPPPALVDLMNWGALDQLHLVYPTLELFPLGNGAGLTALTQLSITVSDTSDVLLAELPLPMPLPTYLQLVMSLRPNQLRALRLQMLVVSKNLWHLALASHHHRELVQQLAMYSGFDTPLWFDFDAMLRPRRRLIEQVLPQHKLQVVQRMVATGYPKLQWVLIGDDDFMVEGDAVSIIN